MKPNAKAEKFDARAYFFDTVRWFSVWPNCAIEQLEEAGFTRIRLERIVPHPVYHIHMRTPAENLTSKQAGPFIRKVIERVGTVPRDGYFCFSPRKGAIEATFVLEV